MYCARPKAIVMPFWRWQLRARRLEAESSESLNPAFKTDTVQHGSSRKPLCSSAATILASAALLLWPALFNGYPLVFSDSGTYISQAVQRYLGWDRPVFYSLFLLTLHMKLTTWPVVIVQSLCAAGMLHFVHRSLFGSRSPPWLLVPLTLSLSVATALPWFTTKLMPDLYTGLLLLAYALLIFVPERLAHWDRLLLMLAASAMIGLHQSNLPLALGLLFVIVPFRQRLGAESCLGIGGLARLVAAPGLAALALISMNLVGHGRVSVSPFGNVFILARVIYDGPGMRTLERECPDQGWRLCDYLRHFPPNSDGFLWDSDSPLAKAGGAKIVSDEANSIVIASLQAEPWAELRAFVGNTLQQLAQFATGDGLGAWPATVTPWIERDFPSFEAKAYSMSRQTRGRLAVPEWMERLHAGFALAGIAGTLIVVLVRRRRDLATGLCAVVLAGLLGNAMITGGLSAPHDRYQSRVMWLPPFLMMLVVPPYALRRWASIVKRLAREREGPAYRISYADLRAA